MEPERILLFGGTFDPPHNGHMTLLAGAVACVRPQLVLIEPSGTPPHKRAGSTPAQHRMAMCECFRPLFSPLLIDDTEIRRGGKSYTVDTVRDIQARYPNARIYFPMGSDMLLWFGNWVAYRELLRRMTIVAHVREDEDAAPMREYAEKLRAEGGTVLFAQAPVFPVSSTQVRAMAARGEPLKGLVPPAVEAYIRENRLYRNTNEAAEMPHSRQESEAEEP